MKREKKESVTSPSPTALDPETEKEFEDFAEVLMESMKNQYNNELEPFEVYAQKLRSQFHTNEHEFRSRIARGYGVLLQELTKN